MIYMYGLKTDYTPNSYTGRCDEVSYRELKATFDTIEQAEQYVKASRLKHRISHTWSNDKVFKQSSVLRNCDSYEFETTSPLDGVLHNPVINKRKVKNGN